MKLSDFRTGFFILVHCAQDDYKSLVDKYCLVRDDFERKMTLAAKHFQEVENSHLKQMREFIESYCQIVDNNNNLLGRVRNIKYILRKHCGPSMMSRGKTPWKHPEGTFQFKDDSKNLSKAGRTLRDLSLGHH